MPEISTDPQRIDLCSDCRLQKFQQGSCSTRGSIIDVMHITSITIRIENVFKLHVSERVDKLPWCHEAPPFSNGRYSIVLLDRSPTTIPPLLLFT
jgi:hypothetical protein